MSENKQKRNGEIATIGDVRMMVRASHNAIASGVEQILQEFQKMQVTSQGQLNAAWNAMNVVLRVFVDRGQITEEDLKAAGEAIVREMHANFEKLKAAKASETTPTDITKSQIEVITDLIAKLRADLKITLKKGEEALDNPEKAEAESGETDEFEKRVQEIMEGLWARR